MNAKTSHPAMASHQTETPSRLADLWPPAVIVVGGLATVVWSGGLAWGAVQLLLYWFG